MGREMSKRDKALSEQLRERASVCRARGDYPSAKAMEQAANRLAQIEREALARSNPPKEGENG